ncbi:hypothetical protein GCM10009796_20930 [Microbacterium koreense]
MLDDHGDGFHGNLHGWQKSYEQRLFCHSWRKSRKHSFSAMALLITIFGLAVVAIVSTFRALGNDGYRRIPTDPRRLP